MACLVSGLEYFHEKNIIHRDIKPENLVIESDGKSLAPTTCFSCNSELTIFAFAASGYLRITDFGIARVWREDNAQDTSGTPGYMAPEVMCRQNHTTTVDFFAVGVMAYECMFGRVSQLQPLPLTSLTSKLNLCSDRTLASHARRSATTSSPSKYRSSARTSREVGPSKLQTSSTR